MRDSSPDAAPEQSAYRPTNPLTDLGARLKFLDLSAADAERLRAVLPKVREVEERFVEEFYRHLFSFDETSRFLADPVLVAGLKELQRQHLQSMLVADWSDSYAEQRRRVGDKHAEVGIEPQFFLGAYCQYLQFCFRHLADEHAGSSPELAEQLLSLIKVVMLDIGLTLDAYFAHSTQSLRSALDMLWKANNELRQFAQLTSHDLKTPLATVANLCDEAIDEFGEQMPAEARKLIEAAKGRTFRMSDMINELLSAVTISDSTELNELVDTSAVFEEVIDRLQADAKSKGVEIAVKSSLPNVWGNRVRLREAFYNLVANAVKFIDKPQGRVEISAQSNGDRVLFSIADNGCGIPHDELERIFSPFRRLPNHRNKPGSGLGLYFAKTLIEQEGGRLWAESTLGEGSRFCALLSREAD